MSERRSRARNSNIELLRVISMLMIVALHYFNQGGILDAAVYGDANYVPAWLIEALSYVSVNIYVLISGWMLSAATGTVKFGKVVRLILQVVFYSVGIYLLFCAVGVAQFNIKTLVTGYLFPLIHGEYWFATVYVVLYLISPFLNKALSALTKSEYRRLLIILGCVFSVIPSVFFFAGNSLGVNGGYSLVWFIFLYFLADYLRRYDIRVSQKYLLPAYLVCCVITCGLKVFQNAVFGKEFWNWYGYASLTVLVGSVALFLFFMQLPAKQNRFWNTVGKTTFGVFLIHTHYIMRDTVLWHWWIKPLAYYRENSVVFLLHLIISVLIIFVVCSVIDWVRERVFNFIAGLFRPRMEKIKNRLHL